MTCVAIVKVGRCNYDVIVKVSPLFTVLRRDKKRVHFLIECLKPIRYHVTRAKISNHCFKERESKRTYKMNNLPISSLSQMLKW